ncbi:MAG: DegT/DnrJ/EryC1/StrS family aminotransferase [Bacteroidota bacterium]
MSIQVFKPYIRPSSMEAVQEVLSSGWIGLGPKTKQFEHDFLSYLGVAETHYAVGLNSNTSGLHIALDLAGVQSGDEVCTVALTFVSTNHVILYKQATPVFVDVDQRTANMCPTDLERKITDRTKAIIVVHLSGYPADMERINALARKHNITVIEDCAHATGGRYPNGRKIGDSDNICVFSFQAVKNLPVGDGGMLTTPKEDFYNKAKKLRWLGIDKDTFSRSKHKGSYSWEYSVPYVGYKYHMTDINAAIGIEQLKFLDEDNARRAAIAATYRTQLQNVAGVTHYQYADHTLSSFHFYPILVENRKALIDHLRTHDIYPGVHYKRNDQYDNYETTDLPCTAIIDQKTLTLPIHVTLEDEAVQKVIDTVKMGW